MSTDLRRARLRRNLPLLCVFRAIQMSLFPVAIITLYLTDHLGLSMTDVFVLQALFSLFTAVLEFPGGYVADRIGYRQSMLIACGLSIVGWSIYTVADDFALIVVAELFLAGSLAFTSGTDSAIMYESLVELNDEPAFTRWLGRSRSLGAFAEGTAALGVGVMFAYDPLLPLQLQTLVWAANCGIALMLVEPHRTRTEPKQMWSHARGLLRYAAIEAPALRATIVTFVTLGIATFVPVWMIVIYAERSGLAVEWIGPMWAVANYTVASGNLLSDRAERRLGLHATLGCCAVLVACGYAGLSFVHASFAFAFYYAICLGRGLASPALNHAQQRLIPSSDRAALLSINSLAFRASFALLGPLVGLSVDMWGDRMVLAGLGSVFFPASICAILWLRAQRPTHANGDNRC